MFLLDYGRKESNRKEGGCKAGKALSVQEIAKAANISSEEVYLGIGWLFKEGKVKNEENLITLA